MRVKCTVTNVTEQISVVLVGLPANLTPFALLTLPTGPDDSRDPDMGTGVVVVLAAGGTVEQIVKFVHG